MCSKTAQATIVKLKMVFARHGIPEIVMADNMPFNSRDFRAFSRSWQFQVVTSSPAYPRSNGLVERNVQTMNRLLKKAHDEGRDMEMVLLEFRNTPITGMDESPAQLLMSRRLQSQMPTISTMLQPTISEGIREKLAQRQQKQKCQYDKSAKPLPDLNPGDSVRYQVDRSWKPATVIKQHNNPRSYYIRRTVIRRNRYYLKRTNEAITTLDDLIDDKYIADTSDRQPPVEALPVPAPPQLDKRQSRYGRVIRPPVRYQND